MSQVNEKAVYTLAEIEKKLKVEQHRLIHLCEKGVITPDFEDAAGRGTVRRFSERNLFEFATALELRRFSLPVAYIIPLMKVLRIFEAYVAKEIEVFSLPRSLQNKPAIRLSLVVLDGHDLFFILKHKGQTSYIGGLDLEGAKSLKRAFNHIKASSNDPTQVFTSRLEVDLGKIAQTLQWRK
jgi:hypothetical protein